MIPPLITLALLSGCFDESDTGRSSSSYSTAPPTTPTTTPTTPESTVVDEDGDGYNNDQDCDDTNADVHPGAPEVPYNGLDDDCNPTTPDDDLDGDGFGIAEDCDDENAWVHPDAVDDCDGGDENCDGELDEDQDADGDSYTTCDGDCDDTRAEVNRDQDEIPMDGLDNDCDGYDQGNCPDVLFTTAWPMRMDLFLDGCAGGVDEQWELNGRFIMPTPDATCDEVEFVIRWNDRWDDPGHDFVDIDGDFRATYHVVDGLSDGYWYGSGSSVTASGCSDSHAWFGGST